MPVANRLFCDVMAGFSISLQQAELALGYRTGISVFLVVCTLIIFNLLTILYATKTCLCFPDVRLEFSNPIDLHLFPTFSISLLLLATMISRLAATWAIALFLAGASLHFLLTIVVIDLWFNHAHFDVVHVNPAWLIPAVGNMLVAIAGVNLGFSELSWFFFSIGIVFWIVLFQRACLAHDAVSKPCRRTSSGKRLREFMSRLSPAA
jgi:tellurite resistance protein